MRLPRALIVGVLSCLTLSLASSSAGAESVTLVPVATDVEQPISTAVRPGDDALYVVEKTGRLRAFANGAFREPVVLDIRSLVSTQNERGLWQAAFPPGPASFVYVTYAAADGLGNQCGACRRCRWLCCP